MPSATGEFEIKSWNEDSYQQLDDGAKLTRASVTQSFTGDLTGTGQAEWLMYYRADGSARVVGLQRVEGSIAGHSGSFVAECTADFDGSKATGTWSVLAGAGTEALAGLRGVARFEAPHGTKASLQFDYKLV